MFNSFGNKVKIKYSIETESKGFAGKIGEICGHTIPSATEVNVIGKTDKDFAINVYFEDTKESYWFDENLIEQLDNGIGTIITLDGIDKKWTKDTNGSWIVEYVSNDSKKRWWEFWK